MDIEYFFQEWDKDKEDNDLAELLEDNVRVVNTIEAEDSEDESGIKTVKMKAWLRKHENSCSGKEPTKTAKSNCLNTRRKPEKFFLALVLMISLYLSAYRV